jgi:hypothetical protein
VYAEKEEKAERASSDLRLTNDSDHIRIFANSAVVFSFVHFFL